MSYSQAWLENPASIRIVLVVVTAYNVLTTVENTFYFSTTGYVTTDGVLFNPVVAGTVGFQESISEDGSVSMSFGDIELYNLNGELDNYLDSTKYVWSNRSIKVYYGDPGWQYSLANIASNFLTIFDGVVDDIDSRTTRTINFRVRDKLERLNSPLGENKIGTYGTWAQGQQNADTSRPIVFGEVFNITPVLINPATLEYVFSSDNPAQNTGFSANGGSEALLEIRDNGVPIYIPGHATLGTGATVNLATSTFTLTRTPSGTVTCSVQGIKETINLTTGAVNSTTYTNTIPNTIAVIATQYGKASTRLSVSELDLPTFNAFNQTAEIGLLAQCSDNVLAVCKDLAYSVGGQLIMSRTGLLRLIQFGTALSTVTSVSINQDDMLFDSLSISRRLGVKAAFKLAYGKNYTVQSGLLSSIPDQHKTSFATEWLTTTASNATIKNTYRLDVDPIEKPTSLISTADATAEATRLNNYFDDQRVVYSFTGKPRLLSLVLGQGVTLTHHRFGLSSGKTGQVIRLAPDWNKQQVEVEVIV